MRFIPIVGSDAGGRDHSIVIPYNALHKVAIQSDSLQLQDERGRPVSAVAATDVKGLKGIASTSLVVNVVGKVKP